MIGMLLFVLWVWLEQFTSVIQVGVKGESWHQVQTHLFNASNLPFKQTALIYVWTKKSWVNKYAILERRTRSVPTLPAGRFTFPFSEYMED